MPENRLLKDGEMICPVCDGEGQIECSDCGVDDEECSHCEGTGVDLEEPCDDPEMEVICDWCNGSGFEECDTCYGEGQIECDECEGLGVVSSEDYEDEDE